MMQSNPEIEKAWRIVNHTNKSLFLTGKAGTGKTTNAKEFAKRISQKEICIVSGMALGIDTAAHSGALKEKGHTKRSAFVYPKAN